MKSRYSQVENVWFLNRGFYLGKTEASIQQIKKKKFQNIFKRAIWLVTIWFPFVVLLLVAPVKDSQPY